MIGIHEYLFLYNLALYDYCPAIMKHELYDILIHIIAPQSYVTLLDHDFPLLEEIWRI